MADSRVSVWIMASRPKTLWAAVSPVIVGTAMAYADHGGHWLAALSAFFGAVMIQIGTNFANDYYDFHKGSDSHDRLGPTRVTHAGLVTLPAMRRAIFSAFGLAFLAGVYLVYRGGWPVVIIGLSSILFGILYTGGPYPLGYNGLGDIFVLIFFGPVAVAGTYYVQTLHVTDIVILAGLAPGLFSVAILTVNNLRDIDSDKRAGKRTLPARFGRTFARGEYLFCVFVGSLLPVLLVVLSTDRVYGLMACFTIFLAVPTIRTVLTDTSGPSLNEALAGTGRILLVYSLLFSIGWLL